MPRGSRPPRSHRLPSTDEEQRDCINLEDTSACDLENPRSIPSRRRPLGIEGASLQASERASSAAAGTSFGPPRVRSLMAGRPVAPPPGSRRKTRETDDSLDEDVNDDACSTTALVYGETESTSWWCCHPISSCSSSSWWPWQARGSHASGSGGGSGAPAANGSIFLNLIRFAILLLACAGGAIILTPYVQRTRTAPPPPPPLALAKSHKHSSHTSSAQASSSELYGMQSPDRGANGDGMQQQQQQPPLEEKRLAEADSPPNWPPSPPPSPPPLSPTPLPVASSQPDEPAKRAPAPSPVHPPASSPRWHPAASPPPSAPPPPFVAPNCWRRPCNGGHFISHILNTRFKADVTKASAPLAAGVVRQPGTNSERSHHGGLPLLTPQLRSLVVAAHSSAGWLPRPGAPVGPVPGARRRGRRGCHAHCHLPRQSAHRRSEGACLYEYDLLSDE